MEISGQLHVPAALAPRKEPGTHWTGGWLDTTVGLDVLGKGQIFVPAEIHNPDRPARNVHNEFIKNPALKTSYT